MMILHLRMSPYLCLSHGTVPLSGRISVVGQVRQLFPLRLPPFGADVGPEVQLSLQLPRLSAHAAGAGEDTGLQPVSGAAARSCN